MANRIAAPNSPLKKGVLRVAGGTPATLIQRAPKTASLVWAALWATALGQAALCARPAAAADPTPPAPMRQYDSPYYTIHTDLEPNLVREAYARLTAMAEEYRERTQGFAGKTVTKLPFYLFSNKEDYLREGGLPGSAGVFTGERLMALALPEMRGGVWKVIQHEGFHQFAHRVISKKLPTWLNEGMAEYFGEGIWTGDGMVTGIIPPGRLKEVHGLIADHKLLGFSEMMVMESNEWNAAMASRNYDQAWSMVHFLVNGDGGKYCQPLNGFINDLSVGVKAKQAFANRFGSDEKAFQARYEQWWASQKEDATFELYAQAQAAILTSYLARAQYLNLKFATAEEFFDAVKDGNVQVSGEKHPRLWLPAPLGDKAAQVAPRLGEWTLEAMNTTSPRLVLKRSDGVVMRGTFTLRGDQQPQVKGAVEKPKATASAPAKSAPAK
jgi:hypothetical protein